MTLNLVLVLVMVFVLCLYQKPKPPLAFNAVITCLTKSRNYTGIINGKGNVYLARIPMI